MKTKIKIPKGYSIKIKKLYQDVVQIMLFRSGESYKIGFVSLYRQRSGVYETHSSLDSKYHHKGLGALMYASAIEWGLKNKHTVRSSGNSSNQARRVWEGQTIRNFFSIKKKKGYIKEYDIWYAYPKKR